MEVANTLAISDLLLTTSAKIGRCILLWNAIRRRHDPEAMLHAHKATQRLSEDRGHHPA